ncbi:RagB/SusD family nutrient uptake outer membrane protein [Pedobacter hiemivivus]|uniref:RagB/SusD family nutrient uptake outer membrane protein n=2 Tax=Pedobacter hiemivivus TaxID=2530454 RepID=A0A4R0MYS0_9SPHI|nr:RagB/SusD family nutrient uptake outer membrane protein [Pedobacter hiemivivus]
MTMKRFRLKYILGLLVVFAGIGCEKVTDQVPESQITGANFFKTASDADNAINACYDALQKNAVNYVVWGDGRTDVFANTDRTQSNDLQVTSGNVGSGNGYVTWNFLYQGINRINGVLKHVPTIPDPALDVRRERIMGEAYFLRGLFYFYLTRTFENIPLVLEPFESLSGELFPKQKNRAEIFTQIELDLKAAELRVPDLPFGSTLENKGRATKGAIRSTLADLYLWQKRYVEAAEMARLVMVSSANYSLVAGASYPTIFTNKNSSESIFEIQYNYTYQEGDTNPLTDLFLPLGQAYTAGNWRFQPSPAVLSALPAGDLRTAGTYRNSGPSPAPYRDPNQTYVLKYPGTVANNVLQQDANRIVYRLPEIILFRAEALNEQGLTPDAITLLNLVRGRANIGGTLATLQGDVRLEIEKERLRELVYEGKRYYDLIRTGRYATVTGNTNPNWLRWPIPAQELIDNPNLVPNPGY